MGADATALALLRDLCLRANIQERYKTFVSQDRVARETGFSVRTVRSKLADLEEAGWIRRRKRHDATDEVAIAATKIKHHAELARSLRKDDDAEFGEAPVMISPGAPSATASEPPPSIDPLSVAALVYSLRSVSPYAVDTADIEAIVRGLLRDHQHEEILVGLANLDWKQINLSKAKSPNGLLRVKLAEAARAAAAMPNSLDPLVMTPESSLRLKERIEKAVREQMGFGRDITPYVSPGDLLMERARFKSAAPHIEHSPWHIRDGGYVFTTSTIPFEVSFFDDNDPDPSPDDEGGDDDQGEGGNDHEDANLTLSSSPRGQASAPILDFDDEDEVEPVEEVEPVQQRGDRFHHERKAFAAALGKETNQFKRPADRITLGLDLGSVVLPLVVNWLESGTYAGKIVTHERVSRQVLRVTLPWNVARYIAENAEKFADDGIMDTNYKPVVDPATLAEIDAEKEAAEELARKEKAAAEELARKKLAEAEAADIQRKADAALAEAARKVRIRELNCRRILTENMDEDSGTFDYIRQTREIPGIAECLMRLFPATFTITHQGDSLLRAVLAPSLVAAIKDDPIEFIEKGWVEEIIQKNNRVYPFLGGISP